MLQEAEDNYYLSAKYLLELANRAYDLFKSSELEERRQLIKLVLSNLRVEGKKVEYDAIKPFNTILDYADRQAWLAVVDEIRTGIAPNSIEYPTIYAQQVKTIFSSSDL
jgi:hypothetical protein